MTESIPRATFNQLSDAERDRRWQRIRAEMASRGVDCLLLNGSSGRWNEMNANIRYVAGYADNLSGVGYAIFPIHGDGTLITQMTVKRSAYAMSWFPDIRGAATGKAADILAERLTDLGLAHGTLGLVGMIYRGDESYGIPWSLYQEVQRKLPSLEIVDVSDLFFELRSVKSEEEIDCLAKSAKLVDAGYHAHLDLARPGATERELYAGIVHAMDLAGAEPPTFLLLSSGAMPGGEHQTGDPIPSNRILQPGDVISSETSPKWAGYQAQGLQCIVLGKPRPEMVELAKYAAEIFHLTADQLRPGNVWQEAEHAGAEIIERVRKGPLGDLANGLWPHCSIAGLGGPDPFPVSNVIQPNQAFMVEMGVGGRRFQPPQSIQGGYCIVSTDGAPRHLSGVPIEKMVLSAVE
jgi:Xaa-Pro aminopeptidase